MLEGTPNTNAGAGVGAAGADTSATALGSEAMALPKVTGFVSAGFSVDAAGPPKENTGAAEELGSVTDLFSAPAAGAVNPKDNGAGEAAGAAGAVDAPKENTAAALELGAGAKGEGAVEGGAERDDGLGSEPFFSSSSMASCTFF